MSTMIDACHACLRDIGIDDPEKGQVMRLYRLVSQCIPDRKVLSSARIEAQRQRDERKAADERVETLRRAIEEVLCDEPTEVEAIRILETAVNNTYDNGFFVSRYDDPDPCK